MRGFFITAAAGICSPASWYLGSSERWGTVGGIGSDSLSVEFSN